jgi:chromosomal replication initiation ATPase DnaA
MPYALARMTYATTMRGYSARTLTLREISRSFSDLRQHHTTLLHACQAVQNIIDTRDKHYYDVVMAIGERLQ